MKDGRFRIPIGAALILGILGLVLFDRDRAVPMATPFVAAALGFLALVEYLKLLGDRIPAAVRAAAGGAGAVLLGAVLWPPREGAEALGGRLLQFLPLALFAVGAALVLARWRSAVAPADFAGAALALAGLAITVLPMGLFAAVLHARHEGVLFGLVIVLGSKLNDMGGYLVGSTVGRTPLCPGISPKKTWEGAAGGLALGIVGTVALCGSTPLTDRLSLAQTAFLGLGLGVTTQFGDLFESVLKRSLGVKDSGTLLPAFGGVLDLLDSLIFAAPFGYTLGVLWLE